MANPGFVAFSSNQSTGTSNNALEETKVDYNKLEVACRMIVAYLQRDKEIKLNGPEYEAMKTAFAYISSNLE